jgi:uncharacterized protein YndB with AHSA1/START domain
MAETFVAQVSVIISAPRARVWDALVNPETIKQYMYVTDIVSEWREGTSIVWKSEFQGKPFEMTGTVLRLEPGRLIEYDRSLPIFRLSGATRSLEGHHRVTIELSDEGETTVVSVTEQDSRTEPERAHSEGGWRMTLNNMKALLEGTSVVPMR